MLFTIKSFFLQNAFFDAGQFFRTLRLVAGAFLGVALLGILLFMKSRDEVAGPPPSPTSWYSVQRIMKSPPEYAEHAARELRRCQAEIERQIGAIALREREHSVLVLENRAQMEHLRQAARGSAICEEPGLKRHLDDWQSVLSDLRAQGQVLAAGQAEIAAARQERELFMKQLELVLQRLREMMRRDGRPIDFQSANELRLAVSAIKAQMPLPVGS